VLHILQFYLHLFDNLLIFYENVYEALNYRVFSSLLQSPSSAMKYFFQYLVFFIYLFNFRLLNDPFSIYNIEVLS
jgi:hypothetical protein